MVVSRSSGLGVGEEPDAAEIDPQQWHARVPGQLGGPQDGAVPTQHQHQFGAGGSGGAARAAAQFYVVNPARPTPPR